METKAPVRPAFVDEVALDGDEVILRRFRFCAYSPMEGRDEAIFVTRAIDRAALRYAKADASYVAERDAREIAERWAQSRGWELVNPLENA